METKVKEFEHFRLHTIVNKKFKRCAIEIHFRNKNTKERMTNLYSLLKLMNRGTKTNPSLKELNKRKEYLYGLSTSCYSSPNANVMDAVVFGEFLNPKYVDDKNYLDDIIKFLFDYIKEPLLSEKDFNIVKEEIKLTIKKQNENLSSKAFLQSKKTVDCILNIDPFDVEEDVDKVHLSDLKEALKDMIDNYAIDIYVIGNLDMDEIEKKIIDNSPFISNPVCNYDYNDFVSHRDVIEVEEKDKFEQSMIVYYYSFEDLSRDERLYEATVLGDVLGSGLNSLLYKDIREKYSLCYNLSAIYMRHFNILRIMVGVDKKNIEKAKERIEYIMNNLDTLINKNNVKDARLNIINGILTNTDSVDYLLFESDAVFNKVIDPMDIKLKKFESVTDKSIKSILPKMKEYTKYVLVGDKNEDN